MSAVSVRNGMIAMGALAALMPSQSHAHDDLGSVQAKLKILWENLDTLRYTVEEYPEDRGMDAGVRRTFTIASGNRRALEAWTVDSDGRANPLEEVRADGRTTFTIIPGEGRESGGDRPGMILIENQTEQHDNLFRFVSRAFWLFAPGGKPLHAYLEDGGRLEVRAGDSGTSRVLLHGNFDGMPITCELDPEHDFLPIRVELEARSANYEYHATSYASDNGRFFPSEGYEVTRRSDGSVDRWLFRVTRLEINRPVDVHASFGRPVVPPGTVIIDRVSGTNSIQGGRARIAPREDTRPGAPPDVVEVSRSSPFFPWRSLLWGVAVLSFAGVLLMWLRGASGSR